MRLCESCPVKAELFALRQQGGYYRAQHERACEREKALKEEIEELKAKLRMRERALFGRKSERTMGLRRGREGAEEAVAGRTPRGHRRGTPGHGRKSYAHLPVVEEWVELPAEKCRCSICGLPFKVVGGSEDSDQVETTGVRAYRRRLRRRRYQPTCQCPHLPLVDGFVARNLTEKQWHADETPWRVFEPTEGKVGPGWWPWVFRSPSAVVFVLDPTRSARVPEGHFGVGVAGILNVDRYAAYKALRVVKLGQVLLAFCWQHVRRDFLDLARDWPDQRDWGLGWVAAIGELVHLNNLRVEAIGSPAAFAPRDAEVRSAVDAIAARREAELAQPALHPERRKTLESLRNHWDGLTVFVDHPEIPMDNSEAERLLRGPAVARKTFYGSVALWAGRLAAALFSLFATLRLSNINPRLWLAAYLEACARHGGQPPPDAAGFLPWNLSEARRRQFAGLPPPDT